jgi:hypothetical protein
MKIDFGKVGRMVILAVVLLSPSGCASRDNKEAAELLDGYLKMTMAPPSGKGNAERMSSELDMLGKKADSAKDKLPGNFHERYKRLVAMTQLSIAPAESAGDLKEVADYIKTIHGSAPRMSVPELTIAAAFAFSEELVRLEMLQSGETDHDKAKASLFARGKK